MPAGALRIGYIPYELFHIYWAICMQGIKTRCAELGIISVLPSVSADDSIPAALGDLLHQDLDAIILPGNLVVSPGFSYAAIEAAGLPTVIAEFNLGPPFAHLVYSNELHGAEVVVNYLFQRIGGAGKIAHLKGGPTRRTTGYQRVLERYPQIEPAFEAQGAWTRAAGAEMMRAALAAHPDLRGVFAHNDQIALGACDVIDANDKRLQIAVVGFDGTPAGLAAVHHGRLAATVYRSTYTVGRAAVEVAAQAVRGEQPARELLTDAMLITTANIVEATLDSMALLPLILEDLLESNRSQMRLQQEIINTQRSVIQELSSPIIPISETISILPLVGTVDSLRAQQIMESMLQAISAQNVAVLIIDITGVAIVDTSIANHLLQAARAAQLLGAAVILVGVSPEIAQTIVQLGVDLSGIPTYSTLKIGLEHARARARR